MVIGLLGQAQGRHDSALFGPYPSDPMRKYAPASKELNRGESWILGAANRDLSGFQCSAQICRVSQGSVGGFGHGVLQVTCGLLRFVCR